jgi:hypothetical protein
MPGFFGHAVHVYKNAVCTTYLACSTSRTGCMAMLAWTRLDHDVGVDIPLTGRLLCFLAAGSRPALSGDSGMTAGYVLIRALHEPTTARIVAKLSSERRLREGGRFRRMAGSLFIRLGTTTRCRNRRPELPSFPSHHNALLSEIRIGLRKPLDERGLC